MKEKQYRILGAGEIIQEGDEFFCEGLEGWKRTRRIGKLAGHGFVYRREIKPEEIKPEPIANGWQSIDTAPKDGTEILLLVGRAIVHGYWCVSFYNAFLAVRGLDFLEGATHWQPLPKEPTE